MIKHLSYYYVLLLLLGTITLSAQTRLDDSIALVNLYNTTGGTKWTNTWDLTQSMDNWYGLGFTSPQQGRVLSVWMENNNITGPIPDLNLTELETLRLPENSLNGSIPNFTNLPKLLSLILFSNNISGSIPDFTNMANLRFLHLNNNKLTGSIPNFTNFSVLEELFLSNNNLTGSIPNFTNLQTLRSLELEYNELSGSIPEFTNLSNLRFLMVNDNLFTFKDLIDSRLYNENQCVGLSGFYAYSPQDSVCLQDTLPITQISVPFTIDLQVDDTVTTSTYYWFKDGILFDSTTTNSLQFPSIQLADTGVYHSQITNPLAPALTLQSRSKLINLDNNNCTNNPSIQNGGMNPLPITPLHTIVGQFSYIENLLDYTDDENNPVIIEIQFLNMVPINGASAIFGEFCDKFTWTYNATSNVLTGTQNQDILGSTGGLIKFWCKPNGSGNCQVSSSGWNAQILPPVCMFDSNSSVDDMESINDCQSHTTIINTISADCTGNNGTATATGTGGSGLFSYVWSNGATSSTINGVAPGTYWVTVTSDTTSVIDSTIVNYQGIPSIDLVQSYGTPSVENLADFQPSPVGGYFLAGTTSINGSNDYLVYKLDAACNIVWEQTYGGSAEEEATSVLPTADGGCIVAGHSKSSDGDVQNNYGGFDYWVLKLNAIGGIEWSKTFGGSSDDKANAIQFNVNSAYQPENYYYAIAGRSKSTNLDISNPKGIEFVWVVYIDSLGNMVNEHSFGGSVEDYAYDITAGSPAGMLITGGSGSTDGDINNPIGGIDQWAMLTTYDGKILWEKSYGTALNEWGLSATPTRDYGFIIAGLHTQISGLDEAYIEKIDQYGNSEWQTLMGGNFNESAHDILPLDDGGYLVAASSQSKDRDVSTNYGNRDVWLVKLDATGAIEWETSYGGDGRDQPVAIHPLADGTFILAGTTFSSSGMITSSNGLSDYWVMKLGPPMLDARLDAAPLTCGSTSTISLTITSGTPPYQYQWNNGSTIDSLVTNLPGIYTVTITEDGGCTLVETIELSDSLLLFASIDTFTNASCNGSSDGTATVSTTGGTPPFSYQWSANANGSTNSTATGLTANTYTVTITDLDGCSVTSSIVIADGNALVITNGGTTAVTCFNGSDGTATITVTGGNAPYTYLWTNGNTLSTATNLTGGNHIITVTDSNNCSNTTSVSIVSPQLLSGNIQVTNPISCNGATDGSASAITTGGMMPYTYQWSANANGVTTQNATGLAANTYTVTITDSNGCIASSSITMTDGNALTITTNGITAVSCFNGSDGTATITVTGGNSPYSYLWTNGSTQSTATNLTGGNHIITVTDSNNCSSTTSVSIVAPLMLSGNIIVTNPISCNGASDGNASVITTGGTMPYTYQWSANANGATTQNVSGLSANTSSVTITDSNNCTQTTSIQLTEPSQVSIGTPTISNATCNNCNGSASLSPTGGTGTYSYQWSSGQTSNQISSLCAGTYLVTVNDSNGCMTTTSVNISSTSGANIVSVATNGSNCTGNSGSIDINATGGTPPLQYSIDAGTNYQASSFFSGLAVGVYTIHVLDANNCLTVTTDSIVSLLPPTIDSIDYDNAICDLDNGSIQLFVSGGTAPYQYSVDGGTTLQSSNSFPGLPQGTYPIYVEDAAGCSTTANAVSLSQESGPSFAFLQGITNSNCGQADGQIKFIYTGGTPPLTFSIDSGATWQVADTFINLLSGNYDLAIQDANGCTVHKNTVFLGDNPGPMLTAGTQQPACTQSTGSVSLMPVGVDYEYSIDFGTPGPNPVFNNLPAGNYSFVIEAISTGCKDTLSVTLTDIPGPTISTTNTQNPTCNQQNGVISIAVNSGTSPFQYSIDNGTTWQQSNVFNGLSANNYLVIIEDGNGCRDTSQSIVLVDPGAPIINSVTTVNPSVCSSSSGSATINASGGTGQLLYSLDSINFQLSNTFVNLPAGQYTFYVFDASNCVVSTTAVLILDDGVSLDSLIVTASSCGLSDGALEILASGGKPPIEYSIDGGTTYVNTSVFSNLNAGVYTIFVRDQDGCLSSALTTLNDASPVLDSIIAVPSDCDVDNGSLTAYVSGGLTPYSYLWGTVPQQTGQSAVGLPAGGYLLTVSDGNSCVITALGTIDDPVSMNVPESDQQVCGMSSVILGSNYVGQSFNWSTGATTNTISVNQTGAYTVTITDFFNCEFMDTIEVLQIPFNSQVSGDTTVVVETEAYLEASGGTSYQWWPSTDLSCTNCPNPVATPMDTTEYFVEIDIAAGCPDTLSVMVYTVNSIDETVVIPDVITPDDDGTNDVWVIANIEQFPFNRVIIVNRWGDVVHEANPYNNDWNGTYKGKRLPQGTYYYYVELDVNQIDTRKGSITLIR